MIDCEIRALVFFPARNEHAEHRPMMTVCFTAANFHPAFMFLDDALGHPGNYLRATCTADIEYISGGTFLNGQVL